jgi:hypothetical protein
MSALGQKQTSDWRPLMSALPPKADIAEHHRDVRFVPKRTLPNSFDQLVGAAQRKCEALSNYGRNTLRR